MTAGHCIENKNDCDNTQFVFDFVMNNSENATTQFNQDQVFSCNKILGWKKENSGADFAIIELDRPVTNRKTLTMSNNKNLSINDEVFIIGHPSGLPSKVTDEGLVRFVNHNSDYFNTNSDTYGGNSGSAVFNAKTYEVEGILVRGEEDFIKDPDLKCKASNYINSNQGRGESSTLISKISENGAPVEEVRIRYVWMSTDQTCNEFRGPNFIRVVAQSYCGQIDFQYIRYVWSNQTQTCNAFTGARFIIEVPSIFCKPL